MFYRTISKITDMQNDNDEGVRDSRYFYHRELEVTHSRQKSLFLLAEARYILRARARSAEELINPERVLDAPRGVTRFS